MMIVYIYKKDLRFYIPFAPKLIVCVIGAPPPPSIKQLEILHSTKKSRKQTNTKSTVTVSTVLKKTV